MNKDEDNDKDKDRDGDNGMKCEVSDRKRKDRK
jgi:hypothetical protein